MCELECEIELVGGKGESEEGKWMMRWKRKEMIKQEKGSANGEK